MARVTFTKDYDHRWPSRAVTAFKAGWAGTVKHEVAESAHAKGAATIEPSRAKAPSHGRLPDSGRGGKLGRSDDAHDVGASVRDQLLGGAGE